MKIRKVFLVIMTLFLAIAVALPWLTFGQSGFQAGQRIEADPNDLAVDSVGLHSLVFPPVRITSPRGNYNSYYFNPYTSDRLVRVHDGRYNGGFVLQVQVTDYVNTLDPEKRIGASNIAIVTEKNPPLEHGSDTGFHEVKKDGTPPVATPLDGIATNGTTYTPFVDEKTPLNAVYAPACSVTQGRIGVYELYPSYRLHIPPTTPAGSYKSTITWTVIDESLDCGE